MINQKNMQKNKGYKQINISLNTELYAKANDIVNAMYGGRMSKYIEYLVKKDIDTNNDVYKQIITLQKSLQ